MRYLDPTFADEFYVDPDPRMLALDFWSYLNARQANLGWSEHDHHVWWTIERALADLKPVLLDPKADRFGPFLAELVLRWRSGIDTWLSRAGVAEEAEVIRHELAEMLADALGRGPVAGAGRAAGREGGR